MWEWKQFCSAPGPFVDLLLFLARSMGGGLSGVRADQLPSKKLKSTDSHSALTAIDL